MSSDATPISPTRFASALKDLPLSTLHLKAAELRNSIAHLDYSNEQLKPFADGTEGGSPDQDCIDAIKENEVVIERMQERMKLLRAEVEGRGSSWMEFRSAEEILEDEKKKERVAGVNDHGDGEVESSMNGSGGGATGANGEEQSSEAWRDGTFQTGRIVNGEIRMDISAAGGRTNGTGGRLGDEALRRAMEERMRALGTDDNEEDGMHL